VHQNMLKICNGVRERALEMVHEGDHPEQATAHVDTLIAVIDDFFAYAKLPQFGGLELVESD